MNLNELLKKIGTPDENGVIGASPITKQPGTVAYRQTIRVLPDNEHTPIVVHTQTFPNFPDLSETHFDTGAYYALDDIGEAWETFAARCKRDASYVLSLLRD